MINADPVQATSQQLRNSGVILVGV